jgi:anti-anti-sigma factor
MASAPELEAFLRDKGSAHERVVLDLSGVSFLDSSGLRALIAGSVSLDGSGPLELVNLSKAVRRVFEIATPSGLPSVRIEGFGGPLGPGVGSPLEG